MDLSSLSSLSIFTLLFHVSNLMAFLAFLLRDQLQLRLLMAVSFFLQGMYYFAVPGGPLFDPLFWKIVSFAANLGMIILVFGGKLDFGVPQDLRGLFDKIKVLSPGQFRQLISRSRRVLGTGAAILVDGERPTHLYFLLKGEAQIIKRGQSTSLPSGIFLGEIAFLNDTAASATVVLPPGSECVVWDSKELKQLLRKDNAINIAMRGVFNSDLAQKLAASLPIDNGRPG
jgi:CRP-like cAMP-binding protein